MRVQVNSFPIFSMGEGGAEEEEVVVVVVVVVVEEEEARRRVGRVLIGFYWWGQNGARYGGIYLQRRRLSKLEESKEGTLNNRRHFKTKTTEVHLDNAAQM